MSWEAKRGQVSAEHVATDDGPVILVHMHMPVVGRAAGNRPDPVSHADRLAGGAGASAGRGQDTAIDLAAVGGKGLSNAAGDGRV